MTMAQNDSQTERQRGGWEIRYSKIPQGKRRKYEWESNAKMIMQERFGEKLERYTTHTTTLVYYRLLLSYSSFALLQLTFMDRDVVVSI